MGILEGPDPVWKPNPGYQPRETVGKRVRVLMAHGAEGSYDPNPITAPGWGADKTRWTLTGSMFDVASYAVI